MLAELNFDLSRLHAAINHVLDATGVQSVENITNPLFINMDPISGIGQVSEHLGLGFSILQEI